MQKNKLSHYFTPLLVILGFLHVNIPNEAFGQRWTGGFGTFMIGTAYNFCPSVQDNLRASDLLGSSAKSNDFGLLFGGSGFALRPRGILLGGSGFLYDVTTTTNRGEARVKVAGGFFDVGYAIINSHLWLGYPYFGMGGVGASIEVTNTTSGSTLKFGQDNIAPASSARYSSGGLSFEFGFSLRFLIDAFSEGVDTLSHAGLVIGIDAGSLFFPAMTRWQNSSSDLEITAYSRPFLLAPYIRATIGISILKRKL